METTILRPSKLSHCPLLIGLALAGQILAGCDTKTEVAARYLPPGTTVRSVADVPGFQSRTANPMPPDQDEIDEDNIDRQADEAAAAARHYTEAEALYRAEIARWHDGIAETKLYTLQDRLGQYTDEVATLRSLVNNHEVMNSTDRRVLVRFADLSMQYGSKDEARNAYLKTARLPICDAKLFGIPVDVTNRSPLSTLRAYAYLTLTDVGGNDTTDPDGLIHARHYAELAVSLAPNDLLPRVVYAMVLGPLHERDRDQWWLAERMATGKT